MRPVARVHARRRLLTCGSEVPPNLWPGRCGADWHLSTDAGRFGPFGVEVVDDAAHEGQARAAVRSRVLLLVAVVVSRLPVRAVLLVVVLGISNITSHRFGH